MGKVEEAMVAHWGERCSCAANGCTSCEAWAEYDVMMEIVTKRRRNHPKKNSKAVIGKNGEVFQSQAEAARFYKTSETNIVKHIRKHGNLDRLGQGQKRESYDNLKKAKKVSIMGYSWETITGCAKDLGVSQSTLSRNLSESATEAQKLKLVKLVSEWEARRRSV